MELNGRARCWKQEVRLQSSIPSVLEQVSADAQNYRQPCCRTGREAPKDSELIVELTEKVFEGTTGIDVKKVRGLAITQLYASY
jgi:hypothetical protein